MMKLFFINPKEALSRLVDLLNDKEKSHFGQEITVAEAAQKAITDLQASP